MKPLTWTISWTSRTHATMVMYQTGQVTHQYQQMYMLRLIMWIMPGTMHQCLLLPMKETFQITVSESGSMFLWRRLSTTTTCTLHLLKWLLRKNRWHRQIWQYLFCILRTLWLHCIVSTYQNVKKKINVLNKRPMIETRTLIVGKFNGNIAIWVNITQKIL